VRRDNIITSAIVPLLPPGGRPDALFRKGLRRRDPIPKYQPEAPARVQDAQAATNLPGRTLAGVGPTIKKPSLARRAGISEPSLARRGVGPAEEG